MIYYIYIYGNFKIGKSAGTDHALTLRLLIYYECSLMLYLYTTIYLIL